MEGAMTPLDAVFSLRESDTGRTRWVEYSKAGTRAFCYKQGKAVAILYAKDLVGVGLTKSSFEKCIRCLDAYKRVYSVRRRS